MASPVGGIDDQIRFVIRNLESRGTRLEKGHPVYAKTLEWINFTTQAGHGLRQKLIEVFALATGLTEEAVLSELSGLPPAQTQVSPAENDEVLLESMLPKGGWFSHYLEYTRYNEAPMSYHVLCSLALAGVCLGRKVWLSFGEEPVLPVVNTLIVGPPGKVKKTTAINLMRMLVEEAAICPVFADKLTPESFQSALSRDGGHQLLSAPELSYLLGKQKYNEGLIQLILRLADFPKEIKVETQTRGIEFVERPTVTIVGGTTPSLLFNSTPGETSSSGFLSRFLVMVEETTHRCFPLPKMGAGKSNIIDIMKWLTSVRGELVLSQPGEDVYFSWYRRQWETLRSSDSATMSEVKARSSVHALRIAMLMHLVSCSDMRICDNCIKSAISLVEYIESKLPHLIKEMEGTTTARETDFVIDHLIRLNGITDHTTLLRKVANRMNSRQFKQHIQTLEESGRIRISKKGAATYYALQGEEN